jgi:hypothetical protein
MVEHADEKASPSFQTPAWVDPSATMFDCTCNLCGALWARATQGTPCVHASPSTDGTQHSDQEWSDWGASQSIPAGEAIPRWSPVG